MATTTEIISSSTQVRAAPSTIASAAAAAKAVVPQRSFIFDYLRSTQHIERCYLKVQYQTQFNPQLSLIPTPQAELPEAEVLGTSRTAGGGGQLTPSDSNNGHHTPLHLHSQAHSRPDVSGSAAPAPYDASTFKSRSLFSMSPAERPPGAAKSLASGRELSELEALGRKHAEEMQLLVPPIVEALRNVMNNHDGVARHITKDDRFDCFNTVSAVVTSLQEYIGRLSEWCYVSPSTFIIACIFLDRMLFRYPRLLYSRQNVYKYYGVALRIANKCVDVKNISNKNYAHVIGVSNVHLNDLEAKLLMDLRFGLYVSPSEFFWYARRLVPYHPTVQRLLSRTSPNIDTINTALAIANNQTSCKTWPAVQIRPVAVMAAQNTQKRRSSVAMHMAALAIGAYPNGGMASARGKNGAPAVAAAAAVPGGAVFLGLAAGLGALSQSSEIQAPLTPVGGLM